MRSLGIPAGRPGSLGGPCTARQGSGIATARQGSGIATARARLWIPMSDSLDSCIERLRRCEYIKEAEVKALCSKAREILVEESNVQRVDAPVTVCSRSTQFPPHTLAAPAAAGPGARRSAGTSTASSTTSRSYSRLAAMCPTPTTCSWGTLWTAAFTRSRPSCCCSLSKCGTPTGSR